jgi:hypothetical protein
MLQLISPIVREVLSSTAVDTSTRSCTTVLSAGAYTTIVDAIVQLLVSSVIIEEFPRNAVNADIRTDPAVLASTAYRAV